jgi:hypothetical protein
MQDGKVSHSRDYLLHLLNDSGERPGAGTVFGGLTKSPKFLLPLGTANHVGTPIVHLL